MTTQPNHNQQQTMVEPLTPKEVEVLFYLFDYDLDYSEIAEKMKVSTKAVHFHVLNIFSKLGVTSRFSAVCTYSRISPEYRNAFLNSIGGKVEET